MLFIIWQKVRIIKVKWSDQVSGRPLDAKHVLYVMGFSPSPAGLGSTAGQAVAAELPEKNSFSDLFSDLFCYNTKLYCDITLHSLPLLLKKRLVK